MKGSLRLTLLSKILILVLIISLIGGGIYLGLSKGLIKTKKNKSVAKTTTEEQKTNKSGSNVTVDDVDEDGNVINTSKSSDDTINLSLDEWIG